MSVEVRRVCPGDDLAAAGRIVQEAYFALRGYPRDPEYDVMLGQVGERARDTDVVVGLLDGTIVACLTYVGDHRNPHSEFDDPDAASFRYFGVDPVVQGKGVGEAMVQWCIDEARRTGKARIRIHTLDSMAAAQRLYLRMGFVRDPDRDEDWDGIIGLAFVFHL